MLETYLHERFPALEVEDLIQQTLVAVVRVLPSYHYEPKEKGAFHNYLTGILRKKALRQLADSKDDAEKLAKYVSDNKMVESEREHQQLRCRNCSHNVFPNGIIHSGFSVWCGNLSRAG